MLIISFFKLLCKKKKTNTIRNLEFKYELFIDKDGLERHMYVLRYYLLNQRLESVVSMNFLKIKVISHQI